MLTNVQKEILDGTMLGDAYIENMGNGKGRLSIKRKTEDRPYLEKQRECFEEYCKGDIFDEAYFHKVFNVTCYSSTFKTLTNETFGEQRARWYPDGIKIVPKDLILTPRSLALWFMDDGTTTQLRKNYTMTFSTQSFSSNDIDFLIEELKRLTGFPFSKCDAGNCFTIKGYSPHTKAAMGLMKEYIFEFKMERKFRNIGQIASEYKLRNQNVIRKFIQDNHNCTVSEIIKMSGFTRDMVNYSLNKLLKNGLIYKNINENPRLYSISEEGLSPLSWQKKKDHRYI